MNTSTRHVLAFFGLTLLLSWPGMLLWELPAGSTVPVSQDVAIEAYRAIAYIFVFTPMLAALIVTAWLEGGAGLRALGARVLRFRAPVRVWLAAVLLPLVPQVASLVLAAVRGVDLTPPPVGDVLTIWLTNTAILTILIIGEELGWRGFALPRLQSDRSALSATLFVGAIWAIWHWPLWLVTAWAVSGSWTEAGGNLLLSTAMCMGIAVLFTWNFNASGGSVFLAMLMHGSNNGFLRITAETNPASAEGDPFYVLAVLALAGFFIWRYGAEDLCATPRVVN